MAKKNKRMVDLVSISARVPKEMAKDLKLVCIHLSKSKGSVFSLSELIRESLLHSCPEEKREGYFK